MPAAPSPGGRAFTPEPQGSRSPGGARGLRGARPSGALPPRPPVGSGPGVSAQGRRWGRRAPLALLVLPRGSQPHRTRPGAPRGCRRGRSAFGRGPSRPAGSEEFGGSLKCVSQAAVAPKS